MHFLIVHFDVDLDRFKGLDSVHHNRADAAHRLEQIAGLRAFDGHRTPAPYPPGWDDAQWCVGPDLYRITEV